MERDELLATVVLFALVFALVGWAAFSGGKAGGGRPQNPAPAGGAEVERFWQAVAEHAVEFSAQEQVCPVDSAKLSLPALVTSNRLGGVATDMMKLALSPNPVGHGVPDLTKQDCLLQYGICPECKATFTELDLAALAAAPVAARLQGFRLEQAIPALAGKAPGQWTADECALARFATLRQAGMSQVELGIAAMQGAYACNLATSVGLKRRFASPAFYSLAASCFSTALDEQGADAAQQAFAALQLGECLRLLGQDGRAGEAFARANAGNALQSEAQAVLAQLEQLLAKKDYNLARAELAQLPRPPLGWYLDELLPAINADIAVNREPWAGLMTTDEVLARMIEQL